MTESLISPGVSVNEIDTSFIARRPAVVGTAIVGPTFKGPINIPTKVTTYSEYDSIFGGDEVYKNRSYSYLTSIAARNYFRNGGKALLITRVAEDEHTAATSFIPSMGFDESTDTLDATNCSFELQTISVGEIMNSGDVDADPVTGILQNGSPQNIRWDILESDPQTGLFTLGIRRGDDSTRNKSYLEIWSNLSLDPNSSNYISKIIGDTVYQVSGSAGERYVEDIGTYGNKSRYVIVKTVNPTLNYYDADGNPKAAYQDLIPKVSEGAFTGATGGFDSNGDHKFYNEIDSTNTQGLTALAGEVDAYETAIELLVNKEAYQFDTLITPGLNAKDHNVTVDKISTTITEARKDHLYVVDLAGFDNKSITDVRSAATNFNSSYIATYWPWIQIINGGQVVWVPASTLIPGVYAFTDSSSEPWFAPAGMVRGALGEVLQASKKLTTKMRDELYSYNVNPIASFPQEGVVVFGQKTTQKKGSALDRVNVRRLLLTLKRYIGQVANTLIFEPNTNVTINNFLTKVNPYLESVQQRQGLYAFKVVMDESINDADTIDRGELRGQIFLQPTRTIEFIKLDFNITPTGAVFS